MIDIYEEGSGSKLNLNKTKGMWLGSKRGQTTALLTSHGLQTNSNYSVYTWDLTSPFTKAGRKQSISWSQGLKCGSTGTFPSQVRF